MKSASYKNAIFFTVTGYKAFSTGYFFTLLPAGFLRGHSTTVHDTTTTAPHRIAQGVISPRYAATAGKGVFVN